MGLACPLVVLLLQCRSILCLHFGVSAGFDEIPPEIWKTRQFDDILLPHCNAVYNQNPIDRWMKGCILPFHKEGDLWLAQNYRGITLTSIAAKIYNALLRNRIEPKIDNILWKNRNGFWRNRSTTSQILTIRRILEGVLAKKHTGDITIRRLYQGLRFHSQREDGTNPTSIRPTKGNRSYNIYIYIFVFERILIYTLSIKRILRCPWCNGYRRRK